MLGEETQKMDSCSFVQLADPEAHLYNNPNPQERSVYGGVQLCNVQCTMYDVQSAMYRVHASVFVRLDLEALLFVYSDVTM